jgi:hypothetical protein
MRCVTALLILAIVHSAIIVLLTITMGQYLLSGGDLLISLFAFAVAEICTIVGAYRIWKHED